MTGFPQPQPPSSQWNVPNLELQSSPTTVSGPPVSGTYVIGQVWVDGLGIPWTCVIAGTAGGLANNGATGFATFTPPPFYQYDRIAIRTSSVVTVTSGSANDSFAHSTQISGSLVTLPSNGWDKIVLEASAWTFMGGTIGATSKGVVSVADITAGGPGAGAIELFELQMIAVNSTAIQHLGTKREPIGVPPQGTRTYALYLWGNTNALQVNLFGQNNPSFSTVLEAVREG